MSGGVDSSVAAYLLKSQGHNVTGLHMTNWSTADENGYCSSAEDLEYVKKVCNALDLPYKVVNFEKEYWNHVFAPCIDEWSNGENTPNPDILCNKEIKFKRLLDYALKDFDYMATGHYVRSYTDEDGKVKLLRGTDPQKDQSYFLSQVTQKALKSSIFPIGNMYKTKVREIAREIKLPNASRKDSYGLCYVGQRDWKNFLSNYIIQKPGDILSTEGDILGKHIGLGFYTIGQSIPLNSFNGKKYYITEKNATKNILIVCTDLENPYLLKDVVYAKEFSWTSDLPPLPLQTPNSTFECYAQIRYRQSPQRCIVQRLDDNIFQILFTEPQKGVATGQALVLYDEDICLGGGIITGTKVLKTHTITQNIVREYSNKRVRIEKTRNMKI